MSSHWVVRKFNPLTVATSPRPWPTLHWELLSSSLLSPCSASDTRCFLTSTVFALVSSRTFFSGPFMAAFVTYFVSCPSLLKKYPAPTHCQLPRPLLVPDRHPLPSSLLVSWLVYICRSAYAKSMSPRGSCWYLGPLRVRIKKYCLVEVS